ncbi:hypothetical protein DUI87_14449 [Hirundo rustica rustica]|uniref:Uncharacterized protein n=1 Tax=Hirundo rustica rustica TaxID=333673 RepID=A0A3M0K545_HIRRU|nr:hypothetical protein DUI87_14449 [Hirundo rustica rustica]
MGGSVLAEEHPKLSPEEATGDQLSCPGYTEAIPGWTGIVPVQQKVKDIDIKHQESDGLKAAFTALDGKFSKATSRDEGIKAIKKATSWEFYPNLGTTK